MKGINVRELCDQLHELATDSNKYRAKKERRTQRSSFRDIEATVVDREDPEEHVRFGEEHLLLDSWTKKRQYSTLCHLLGPGMNTHLQENELVREIFQLGPVRLASETSKSRGSKLERVSSFTLQVAV